MAAGVHGSFAPCGTYAGYQTHKRLKTKPCERCRTANTEYSRARRRDPVKRRIDARSKQAAAAPAVPSCTHPELEVVFNTTNEPTSLVCDCGRKWLVLAVGKARSAA